MVLASHIATVLVALIHLPILVLEMFLRWSHIARY